METRVKGNATAESLLELADKHTAGVHHDQVQSLFSTRLDGKRTLLEFRKKLAALP
jgi:hypothetical protein